MRPILSPMAIVLLAGLAALALAGALIVVVVLILDQDK